MSLTLYFFCLVICDNFQYRKKPYLAILKNMLPVWERYVPSFHQMHLEDIKIPECFMKPRSEMCALLVSTPRLCSLPNIDINSRIVIVGASTCAAAFLDCLNMYFDGHQHVNFNNLTLIYDRSSVNITDLAKYSARMFVFRGKYSAEYLHSFKNKTHVNYMYGSMKAINR